MTNLTTEEIRAYKEIIKSAPNGATHYVVLQYDMIEVYWRIDDCCIYTLNEDGETWCYREGVEADGCYLIDSLEHIRTILAQQQEIERLRRLLGAAVCPCCDKSGAYYDNYGEIHQCQWCYEVNLKGESDE